VGPRGSAVGLSPSAGLRLPEYRPSSLSRSDAAVCVVATDLPVSRRLAVVPGAAAQYGRGHSEPGHRQPGDKQLLRRCRQT